MATVTPEQAQRLFDAINAEREQYKTKIQGVMDGALAEAKAMIETDALDEGAQLIDNAIAQLGTIVPDAPVNASPEEPSETPVDEAATDLVETIEEPVAEVPEEVKEMIDEAVAEIQDAAIDEAQAEEPAEGTPLDTPPIEGTPL